VIISKNTYLRGYHANRISKKLTQQMEFFNYSCRAAGLKITHQRTLIYRELLQQPDHPTAEALHKRIVREVPSISLDTVYRTLATLEQHRLVSRIQTAESQARFEAVIVPHHHLICSCCKKVLDIEWPEFDQIELPENVRNWGTINSKNAVMYGTCTACAST